MNREATFTAIVAPRRDSRHWEEEELTWGTLLGWVEDPADRKACGNYVLGRFAESTVTHPGETAPCTALHRRKTSVVSRSALTLDVDYPESGFLDAFEMVWPHAALVHTTWSSTADEPRYRLILPLDRDAAPDEYAAAAQVVMDRFGADQFDPGSVQPERYMFRPSTQDADAYTWVEVDGEPVPVDELLEDFSEDLSAASTPPPGRRKRDPFKVEGVVGAFNRAYEDWDTLIEEYGLSYEPSGGGRYHLSGARSASGMGPIADAPGLVFSHHLHDPAYGQACSAFDLARLHLYAGEDDGAKPETPVNRLPSHKLMLDTAVDDPRVKRELQRGARDDFSSAGDDVGGAGALDDLLDDDNAWKIGLTYNHNGTAHPSAHNRDLIVEHDPLMRRIAFNEMGLSPEWTTAGALPWRSVRPGSIVTTTDRTEMAAYLEREYQLKLPLDLVSRDIDRRAARYPFNPVRDYLDGLEWDGVPRVETCLPGVVPTPESRLIARKVMTAAVARVYEPGCKWDHTLVLTGPEGLGKSWWIDKMARGWTSSLGPVTRKDTMLTMQRSWIVVSDEGHALFKGSGSEDLDAQKEFLTRTTDVFRAPYAAEAVAYPRRCVIWSTTNDHTMLSRQEGNRRFLVVKCEHRVDFDGLTDEYVGQVWAEAVALWRGGERLFLDAEESTSVAAVREEHIEEDALLGIVEEYLEQRVPENWGEMTSSRRRAWLVDRADGMVPEGSARIDTVCSTQIWCEALGKPFADRRRSDLLAISRVLDGLPGWSRVPGRERVSDYGSQSVVRRDPD